MKNNKLYNIRQNIIITFILLLKFIKNSINCSAYLFSFSTTH